MANKYADEAIQAELDTIGKVGYVANNYQTVKWLALKRYNHCATIGK